MKPVDLDLLRKALGKFSFNGKEYVISDPTLKQTLTHYKRSIEITDQLKEMDDEDPDKMIALWEWKKEEVHIYVPELSPEDIENMTPQQINAILDAVEPRIEEEETKKNKGRKGKR